MVRKLTYTGSARIGGAHEVASRDEPSWYEGNMTGATDAGCSSACVGRPGAVSLDDSGGEIPSRDIGHVVALPSGHIDDTGLLGGEVEGRLGPNIVMWRTRAPALRTKF